MIYLLAIAFLARLFQGVTPNSIIACNVDVHRWEVTIFHRRCSCLDIVNQKMFSLLFT